MLTILKILSDDITKRYNHNYIKSIITIVLI